MKQDREEALTLELLSAIEAKSDVTQRHLADRLGVALGLANSYLRRCVHKGLVKITQAPANRYLYYLTPIGFAEKSRLTAQYFAASLDFYRRASDSMGRALAQCSAQGAGRITFAGVSELAEIGAIQARDFALDVIGILDPDSPRVDFLGRPVWRDLYAADAGDAVVLTAVKECAKVYEALRKVPRPLRIVVPDLVQALLPVAGPAH